MRLGFAERALLFSIAALALVRFCIRRWNGAVRKKSLAAPRSRVKHERLGHVAVVRSDFCEHDQSAAAFAASFQPPVYVVLQDAAGVEGELRTPTHCTLYVDCDSACAEARRVVGLVVGRAMRLRDDFYGDLQSSPTFTCHTENGVKYAMDAAKVMFSSGNTTERMHFGSVDATGEVVVDMFAGIGYFTLPIASRGKPKAVLALEKNPDSARYLRFNAELNRLDAIVTVVVGDNREVGVDAVGTCDRVIMGYIPSAKPFIRRAVAFLRKRKATPCGVIHYHMLCDKAAGYRAAHSDFVDELGEDCVEFIEVVAVRVVKSYAPKRWHCVADVQLGLRMH